MQLPHKFHDVLQPPFPGESVQPPAEARDTQRLGDVAHTSHHEQSVLMVVLEVHRGDYCHQQYFSVTNSCQFVSAVSKLTHCILDDAQNGYNLGIVHVVAPLGVV
jgi:hypothetical protein